MFYFSSITVMDFSLLSGSSGILIGHNKTILSGKREYLTFYLTENTHLLTSELEKTEPDQKDFVLLLYVFFLLVWKTKVTTEWLYPLGCCHFQQTEKIQWNTGCIFFSLNLKAQPVQTLCFIFTQTGQYRNKERISTVGCVNF